MGPLLVVADPAQVACSHAEPRLSTPGELGRGKGQAGWVSISPLLFTVGLAGQSNAAHSTGMRTNARGCAAMLNGIKKHPC